MVATALNSSGSWMAFTSIIVICLFMVIITWLKGNMQTKMEVEIGTQASFEGVVTSRHFTTEVGDPPSYASIQSEVTPTSI